jgi:hypothetical protein
MFWKHPDKTFHQRTFGISAWRSPFNCASIKAANYGGMRDRASVKLVISDQPTRPGKDFLVYIACLMAAGFFIALAPTFARASEDERLVDLAT